MKFFLFFFILCESLLSKFLFLLMKVEWKKWGYFVESNMVKSDVSIEVSEVMVMLWYLMCVSLCVSMVLILVLFSLYEKSFWVVVMKVLFGLWLVVKVLGMVMGDINIFGFFFSLVSGNSLFISCISCMWLVLLGLGFLYCISCLIKVVLLY